MAGMSRATGTGVPHAEPLSASRLRVACTGEGSLWSDIRVTGQTGSTNADALARARDGAAEGLVIAAETQTAGRGRQGRSWVSLPGAALTFSVLVRPGEVPQATWGWVPLLAGVAAASAIRSVTSLDATLKWPNDVLAGGGKLAGILAERSGDAIVIGIGINVLGRAQDLPVSTATSLQLHGAGDADRTGLLAEILRQFEHWYVRWRGSSGDAQACGLRARYRTLCATLGSQVRVELPGGRALRGLAADVDECGRLLVAGADGGVSAVSAGDVLHVR